ncbi:integrin alpha-E [Aquarana catesbeiana]
MMDLQWNYWSGPTGTIWTGSQTGCFIFLLLLVPSGCFNIDTGKTWRFDARQKSLFGQSVMQYKENSEKGVYVVSPLEEFGKRKFEGIFKCALNNGNPTLDCTMDNILSATGQGKVVQGVPYPTVSQARSSDSTLTCQQIKARKHRSTTGELNGVCSRLTYENGDVRNFTFSNLAKTVYSLVMEKNKPNNLMGKVEALSNNDEMKNDPKEMKRYNNDNSNNNNNNNDEDDVGEISSNIMEMKNDLKEIKSYINDNSNNNNNNNDEDDDGGTEIAIVLDGSGSIQPHDFQKAKDFISNLMTKIWEQCSECEFAVVQYGDVIQTEFDIQDSRRDSSYILHKAEAIKQVGNVTKTASALLHVLDNIFNETHGSKESATKIILVLTDGDIFMDPVNLTTVINDQRIKNIERFIIGVGDVFNKTGAYSELKMIASDEKDHVIRVDDYSKLDGLLSALRQRIIGIEGTTGASLEFDLAQIGFSAHIKDKDTVVLGAVGAFDWSGGLLLASTELNKVKFLNESSENATRAAYGYLGYSVTTARGKHTFLYIAGAPRHSNRGKVLVFEEDITTYHLSQILDGEQIGSYFGHQLCALDVKSNGIVDFLLVGAPFYHVKGEEGKVYVYRLSDEGKFALELKLEQHRYSYARFGYSIAKIGDVNQDGYQDFAIGAPLEGYFEEPESFGSVYIYNSNARSIHTTHSQKIRATDCRQKLQFFGQSVDGGLDLTDDGYADIAVGSLGNVMVLRSRPVVKARAFMRFQPEKISLLSNTKIVNASLCFDITPFKKEEFKKTYLYYELELDVSMKERRIAFNTETSSRGKLYLLSSNCTQPITLTVLPCIYDCFSNIVIKVFYNMTATEKNRDLPSPVLDFYDTNYASVELPYEKDCNNKAVCIPRLHLTTVMSRQELIVGYTKDLTMTLGLENTGDDSYMTNITLIYPKNLQFKTIKPTNNPSIKCYEQKIPNSYNSTLNCTIRHPVFKSGKETFDIIWQLSEEKFSAAEAIIYSTVSNMNGVPEPINQKKTLPVKHFLNSILTVHPNALYVRIPPEPDNIEKIEYTFNINGENQYDAELSLELQIPINLKSKTISAITLTEKTQNSTMCNLENRECRCRNASRQYKEEVLTCLAVRCKISSMPMEITVKAELFLKTLQKLVEDTQELNITGELLYDKHLFINVKDPELRTQLTINIIKEKVVNILPVIIGSSIGGIVLLMVIVVILVKCGFFKRKYKTLD